MLLHKMPRYRTWGPSGPRIIILIVISAVTSLQFHQRWMTYRSPAYGHSSNDVEPVYMENAGNYTSISRRDWSVSGDTETLRKILVQLEPHIIPEIAYRLARNNHNLDSLDALINDEEIAYSARLLQYELRSLGISASADMVYYMRIFQFARDYNLSYPKLYEDLKNTMPVWSWRYFCYRYLDRARVWELPSISIASDKEAVLVETRVFPHVEFVVRAFLKNMGPEWMVTLICSDENEGLMRSIAAGISTNIRLLKLREDLLSVDDYNNLLLTPKFWKKMRGEKVLIFQEDSILFQQGIDTFLPYDFVGAVWPSNVEDVPSRVGNGGLSVRNRSVMIRILEHYDMSTFIPSNDLWNYMASQGLKRVPEDIYFAHIIEKTDVGRLAPRNLASKLVESIVPDDLDTIIGGHQWWAAMAGTKWLEFAHEKLIIQLSLPPNTIPATNIINHRGGWKHVLKALINHDLVVPHSDRKLTTFIKEPSYEYVDVLEHLLIKSEPWMIFKPNIQNNTMLVAFMHGTLTGRFTGDVLGLEYFWSSSEFQAIRLRIPILFTFSEMFASRVRELVKTTSDMEAQVAVIQHPMPEGISETFDANRVLCPTCKKRLVALGQQHRCSSTIYLVNTTWEKYWLPSSTLSETEAYGIASAEMREVGIEPTKELESSVKIIKKTSYLDYERFITSAVLLVHLRDGNANNAVLEAIAMEIPVIINRHPAAIEYLGKDYPLYIDGIGQIQDILKDPRRIDDAARYLKTFDKSRFQMTTFLRNFDNHLSNLQK